MFGSQKNTNSISIYTLEGEFLKNNAHTLLYIMEVNKETPCIIKVVVMIRYSKFELLKPYDSLVWEIHQFQVVIQKYLQL